MFAQAYVGRPASLEVLLLESKRLLRACLRHAETRLECSAVVRAICEVAVCTNLCNLKLHHIATRAEARRAIFAWINRYNSRRRHSTLGYIAPIT